MISLIMYKLVSNLLIFLQHIIPPKIYIYIIMMQIKIMWQTHIY